MRDLLGSCTLDDTVYHISIIPNIIIYDTHFKILRYLFNFRKNLDILFVNILFINFKN